MTRGKTETANFLFLKLLSRGIALRDGLKCLISSVSNAHVFVYGPASTPYSPRVLHWFLVRAPRVLVGCAAPEGGAGLACQVQRAQPGQDHCQELQRVRQPVTADEQKLRS